MMFLHYLLNRNEDEMIAKVLKAQIESPTKNDWFSSVQNDLKEIGLNYLSLIDIKSMKKATFKRLLKEKINDTALKYLLEGNEKMSKLNNLKYYQLKLQPYLKSTNITTRHQND